MGIGLFDSVKGNMIHYFVRPNDYFILNTLEKLDANAYLYRLLRDEGYRQIFFVDIRETNFSVITYDQFSYWATVKPKEFDLVDVEDPAAMSAFLGETTGAPEPSAGNALNTRFIRTVPQPVSEKRTQIQPLGRYQLQTFATQAEFVAFVLNRISPAINSDKVKTAVVMPMEIFEDTGRISQSAISSEIIETIRTAQKENRSKRNIVVLTTPYQDNLANCMDITNLRDVHYWVNSVQRKVSYQDDRVASAVEELQKEGILVLADSICEDEIVNLLLRKKLVECDRRFARLQVSRIYQLAELLAEQCRMERRHFQSFAPFKMHDYIRQLEGLLSSDRVVEELVEKSLSLKARTIQEVKDVGAVALERVTHRYIPRCRRSREEIDADYQEAMAPLDHMIGMGNIKSIIEKRHNKVWVYGGSEGPGHYIFAGNPGTGKTVAARMMGDIFKALGLLRKGHLVECKKADLVAEHIGGSAIKTKKKCMEALDGVLFVDEAYELVNLEPNGQKFKSSFDEEAYTEIMTFMENNKQRVCVIFAGYPEPMKIFRTANPGMPRRLPESNIIEFADYTIEELCDIFALFAKNDPDGAFVLSEEFSRLLKKSLKNQVKSKDFGNAGQMRELFRECKQNAASRVYDTDDEETKYLLLPEDLPETYNPQTSEEQAAAAMAELNELIGLDNVKSVLRELLDTQLTYDNEEGPGHYVFSGNPGTGKTQVARLMGRILKAQGLLAKGHLVECKSTDLVAGFIGQSAIKTRAICESALDGVLFIDEAYNLVNTDPGSTGYTDNFAEQAYNELMTFMYNNRQRICVIFAGYTRQMQAFVNANPGMERRITKEIHFPDYNEEELLDIFKLFARKSGGGFTLSREFDRDIRKVIRKIAKQSGSNFGNAGAIRKLFESVKKQAAGRYRRTREESTKYVLLPQDIPEEYNPQLSEEALQNAMSELNDMIGLSNVKNVINEMVTEKKIYGDTTGTGHFVFAGNPGTGKTEVARMMGRIFKAMGLLTKGHVVVCDGAGLVGQNVGETPAKVRSICEEALGGVLFVDEAYRLINTESVGSAYASSFAEEAYTEIMTFMEDNRHRVCVIFAGYRNLMEKFLDANEGMRSRVSNIIDFPDYTDDELLKILKRMAAREGYSFAPDFDQAARNAIALSKLECTGNYANARQMRNLLSQFRANVAQRMLLLQAGGHYDEVEKAKYILTEEDTFTGSRKGEREDVSAAMAALDAMIGLENVKNTIRRLKNRVLYSANPDASIDPGHYLFVGNPGTGKTEVARLMGRIFKAIGLLPRGHVVEVDRSRLVGQYIGQTAPATEQCCREALGGILFVDEAYTLFSEAKNDFGREALNTIMKFMEDHRKQICVIFVGYEEQMAELISINPGFTSRIRETIHFPNYSPDELIQILRLMADKQKLAYTDEFLEEAKKLLKRMADVQKQSFGNARAVRALLEEADGRRADRIAMLIENGTAPDSIQRNLLTAEDLDFSDKAASENEAEREPDQPSTEYRRIPVEAVRDLLPCYGREALTDRISLSRATDPAVLFVQTDSGCGTAFLISPEGYAITCSHVVSGAKKIHARFRMPGRVGQDDSWHICQVVNNKSDLDIALLKLEGGNFPYLKLASQDREIQKGEDFLLSGYPFGQRTAKDLTTFYGYVASSDRQTDENGFVRYNINSEAKSGNSGAPIIALSDGAVIGVLLGSMTVDRQRLVEEINYMRPIRYFWEEFVY